MPTYVRSPFHVAFTSTVVLALLGGSSYAIADPKSFNISPQEAGRALMEFGRQSSVQILFETTKVKGVLTNAVKGNYEPIEALRLLLKGTQLTASEKADGVIVVQSQKATHTSLTHDGADSESSYFRITRVNARIGDDQAAVGASFQSDTQGGSAGPTAPTAKIDPSNQLEEILVTATKRLTTIQDIPISVTAVSGDEIQNRGIPDFNTLAQSIPGLSMRTSGPGQTEFEMRGMTSAGGNSSTVGFYLDDTPLTSPAAAQVGKVVIDPNLYDVSRVEVLRGPQGTLYGSGSMGGTIKIVPNAPDPRGFDASAQAVLSDTDGAGFNHLENAMVNLPLSDTLAVRIVGTKSYDTGWIDRKVVANGAFPVETNYSAAAGNYLSRGNVLAAPLAADYKDVNDVDLTSAHISVLWQATEDFTITPSLFYQRIKQDGLNDIDSDPGTNAFYQPFDVPEPFSDRFTLGSLNLKYSFKSFDLISTTSQWVRDLAVRQDGTEGVQWALSADSPTAPFPFYPSQGGIGANYPANEEDDRTKQISEEIRVTSTGDSKFQWIGGYFYEDFRSDWDLHALFPDATPLFGIANAFTQLQPTKIIQNSIFGEISYQITPQLKATVGGRRYSFDSSVSTAVSGFLSSTGSDDFAYSANGERDQGFNPKADISYALSRDLMLYTTVSKGFRPGGGNEPVPTSGSLGDACEAALQASHNTTAFVAAPTGFKPDSVWSYEAGEKAKALDSRLTVNSDIYFEQWRGVQQNVPLSCGFPYTDNSGDAHIRGAEVEINTILLPGLILAANAAYTHATFVVGSLEAGVTAGTRVQDVPEWTSSVSLNYRYKLNDSLALTSRIQNNYVGARTDATYAVNNLPSYDLTDLRLGVEAETWKATLFAKNALNKRAIFSDATQINVNTSTFNRLAVSQPLTIGIDLSYHFGR